jgi:hypothetical protein
VKTGNRKEKVMAGKTDKTGADKTGAETNAADVAAPIEAEAVAAPVMARDEVRRPAKGATGDMAALSAAHRAFAEAVMKGQRRNTLLAAGAAGGAVVSLVLAGLVYFQSVEDLRVAADVQAEAAKLLVEEVKQIDVIGDVVAEQQDVLKTDLLATLELVKDEIRRAAMAGPEPEPEPEPEAEPMDAQIANAIREGVKADLNVMRDEILTALAEAELALLNGTGDPAMTELVEAVKALVADEAPPAPVEAAARSTPAAPSKPRPKPQPAEPNPFTYP